MFKRKSWVALSFAGLFVVGAGLAAGQGTLTKAEVRLDIHGDPLPPGAVARLGTVRFRAPDEADALAFAPDGKMVAVSSRGGLYLFDAESGKRIKRLGDYAHGRYLQSTLAFSPDGKRLAGWGETMVADEKGSYSSKNTVRVWELLGDGKPRLHDGERVMWIGWSAEGEALALSLEKGAISLRELVTGRARRFECPDLRRRSEFVMCVCAPAGRTLAVADDNNIIHIWDTGTSAERCTVTPNEDETLRGLAMSPDGRQLAMLTQGKAAPYRNAVHIVDAMTGKVLRTVATDQKNISRLTFAPDGKTLATAGWNGIRCWDVATAKERSRSEGVGANTVKIAFSGDGQTLATLQRYSGTFHLWDVATGKQKPEPAGHSSKPSGTSFSPDGRRFASGGYDGVIHVWDLATSKSLFRIHRPGHWVRRAEFSRDGQWLFSTWTSDEVWIYQGTTGERHGVMKLEDPERPDTSQEGWSMHLSADGKTLVALSHYLMKKAGGPHYDDALLTSWDTATRKQVVRRRLPHSAGLTAVSVDARLLAMAHAGSQFEKSSGHGPLRVEELATGQLLLELPALEGQTWPLTFSADGRLLASVNSNYKRRKESDPASTGANIVLWELATGAEVLALPAVSQYRVAFSANGRLLAITAPMREISVWDLARGNELRRLKGFDAEVTWLTFTPDGRRLISGHADSTLLVWDVPASSPPAKLAAADLDKAWADVAGSDAPRAFRARWALVNAPDTALALLQKHLAPVRPADPDRLWKLLEDLDSQQFAVRAAANRELEELGDLAAHALTQTLAKNPSLELRRRIDTLLEKLRGPITRPEFLRAVRAVAVLEDIASPDARKHLQMLAQGAPGTRLTEEAQAALRRLESK